jgi:hypothetical protein
MRVLNASTARLNLSNFFNTFLLDFSALPQQLKPMIALDRLHIQAEPEHRRAFLNLERKRAMSQALDAIVLKNACALLASEHRWTSGAWAREARGNRCSPLSQNAVRWCAVGALQKCAYDLIGNKRSAYEMADGIAKHLVPGPGGLVFVNERGGYALVSNVMRAGGPPKDADAGWPFIDFFTRQGFGAFARGRGTLAQPA